MIPRDSQRSKIYQAENILYGKKFATLEDCQKYIMHMFNSSWFKKNFPEYKLPPTVLKSKGGCFYRMSEIHLSRWGFNERVVIHEFAHYATSWRRWQKASKVPPSASHGWLFASVFLMLVRKFMDEKSYEVLKSHYKYFKVKYHAPRAKQVGRVLPVACAVARDRRRLLLSGKEFQID